MDYHITDQMLNDAIGAMPVTFDSHAIIEALMTARPREYVHDLYEHYLTAQDDPIKELHAAIGRRLAGLGTLTKTRKVLSRNVRGRDTENQEWRR